MLMYFLLIESDLLNTFRVQCEQVSRPFPSSLPDEDINDWLTAATRSPYTTHVQIQTSGATNTSRLAVTAGSDESSSTSSSTGDRETATLTSTTTSKPSPPASTDPGNTNVTSTVAVIDYNDSHTFSQSTTLLSTVLTASHSPHLSAAAISGTAAGGAFVLVFTVGLVYWLLRRKRKNKCTAPTIEYYMPNRISRRPALYTSNRVLMGSRMRQVDPDSPGQYRGVSTMENGDPLPLIQELDDGGCEYQYTNTDMRCVHEASPDDDGRRVDTVAVSAPSASRPPPPLYLSSRILHGIYPCRK
ncbi:hypothetical protein J1614_001462 [Plenodomus biglobosus]|nr:hypothetical protein J1614_001462 [Plenodomus biglobosus]